MICYDAEIPSQMRLNVRHSVCSSSDGLVARLAVPDPNRVSLDGGLSAESADVSGVLGDFHLLDLLSQGGTISAQIERLAGRCEMEEKPFVEWFVVAEEVPLRIYDREISSSSPTTRIDALDGVDTYLVPYLPVTPTFLVLFVIFADVAGMNRCWRWEEMSFSRSALL